MTTPPSRPFAPARNVIDVADCYFYHREELPGIGPVGGEWDLRGGEEAYLGGVALSGKRVLEMGTASGYLCRYMEARGAEVVAFDLSAKQSWDVVPFAEGNAEGFRAVMQKHIDRLNNGWWLAHRLCRSRASVVYGDVYDVPEAIGPVDVSTFGAILLHVRDPFQALYNALRLTRETVIVTDVHPEQPPDSGLGTTVPPGTPPPPHPGALYFRPDPAAVTPGGATTWWSLPPELICRFLAVLGFGRAAVTEHAPLFLGKRARLYTVVGTRTALTPTS